MSRGIKDLRDIIVVSRLAYTRSDPSDNNYSSDDSTSRKLNDLSLDGGENAATDTARRKRRKRKKRKKKGGNGSGDGPSEVSSCEPATTPDMDTFDVDSLLAYADANLVAEWLNKSSELISTLANWCHDGANFVRFAHFWLSDFSHDKRLQIFKLEVEIFMDQLKLLFRAGLDGNKTQFSDVLKFSRLILHEYPTKVLTISGLHLFLSYLDVLSSERTLDYRKLLSDVHLSTDNKQWAQVVLALRCYGLVSIWSAIVNFYKRLDTTEQAEPPVLNEMPARATEDERRAVQAIHCGHTDVLHFLLSSGRISSDFVDADGRSLPFIAVTVNRANVVKFLIQQRQAVDLCQPSKSGNTILHAAVNTGSEELVRLVLSAVGIDPNVANSACDGAAPLHLAVLHGNCAVVSLLLSAGADPSREMNGQSAVELAVAFEQTSVHEILIRHLIT